MGKKKAKSPAFQVYPGEWLSSQDIMLMTPSQEGAYIRLLFIAWLSDDCGLPDDDEQLASLSRLGDYWLNGGSLLVRKKFFLKDGRLYNKRLLKERKKQEEWRKKSQAGGVKSGRARNYKKLSVEGWLQNGLNQTRTKREPKGNSLFLFSVFGFLKDFEGSGKKKPDPRIRKIFDFWDAQYRAKYGRKYAFTGKKEGDLIKKALTTLEPRALCERIKIFFATDDEWILKTGHTIGIFHSTLNLTLHVPGSARPREADPDLDERRSLAKERKDNPDDFQMDPGMLTDLTKNIGNPKKEKEP